MFITVAVTLAPIMLMNSTPKKLKNAAIKIAALGLIARVETQVAIALGASVHPFTKITPSVSSTVTRKIGFADSWLKKSVKAIRVKLP